LLSIDGLLVRGGTPLGADFAVFWSAAALAAAGNAPAVLDPGVFPFEQQRLVGETFETFPWFYPPHLLLLIRPLGFVSYVPGWVLWSATGFAAFAFASFHAARRFSLDLSGIAIAGLLIAPAAMMNLIVGQLGFFTSALLVGGVTALGRRPVLAGVLLGLLTVKPHLGFLVPFLLIAGRAWRTVFVAVATTAALVAASLLIDGAETWRAFLDHLASNQAALLSNGPERMYNWMPSVFAGAYRLGLPLNAASLMHLVIGAVAFVAIVRGLFVTHDLLERFMLIAVGTFVVAPYALAYDMALLVTATLLYVTSRRAGMSVGEHWLWVAVWVLPFCLVLLGPLGAFSGPLVLCSALAAVLRRIEQRRPQRVGAVRGTQPVRPVPIAP
jgi:hypothetical protein